MSSAAKGKLLQQPAVTPGHRTGLFFRAPIKTGNSPHKCGEVSLGALLAGCCRFKKGKPLDFHPPHLSESSPFHPPSNQTVRSARPPLAFKVWAKSFGWGPVRMHVPQPDPALVHFLMSSPKTPKVHKGRRGELGWSKWVGLASPISSQGCPVDFHGEKRIALRFIGLVRL